MSYPKGKYPDIDTVSQNRLNATEKLWNLTQTLKNCSKVLGVTPGELPPKTELQVSN